MKTLILKWLGLLPKPFAEIPIAFMPGWVGSDVRGGPLGVRINPFGMVEFEGAVWKESGGTFETAFTLPEDYRPATTCFFAAGGGAHDVVTVAVHLDGQVTLKGGDLAVATYLHGITYRVR